MLLLIAIAMFCGAAVPMQAKLPPPVRVIQFSGYRWNVRPAGVDGPGPNQWDPQNVRLDPQGRLHLKITRRGGVWCCAEVWTQKSFGFGHYQFQVTGLLDRLDPNVVLGLFNYPPESVGPDGTNEIDILGRNRSHMGLRCQLKCATRPSALIGKPVASIFNACAATGTMIRANMRIGPFIPPTADSVFLSSLFRFTSIFGL
jgi:hypothetical protein